MNSENKYKKHETQKPLSIVKRCIEASSNEKDLICDFFNGSGTSAVASKMLNRRYIGFEINKTYIDITKLRLEKEAKEKEDIRKKAEKELHDVRSAERRSKSGLTSIDKKIESEREDASDVSGILTQKNAQLESIERLVTTAQERLVREKEEIERAEQEIEFSETPEEKQNAEARLRSLNEHVVELTEEIKSRQKTAKKIAIDAEQYSDIQSKISTKIQKQTKSKPTLRETMTSSHKAAEKLLKEFERRTKAEETAKKLLDKASVKLQEFLAKKRKSAKKKTAKKKPARKTAAKKKTAKKKSRR